MVCSLVAEEIALTLGNDSFRPTVYAHTPGVASTIADEGVLSLAVGVSAGRSCFSVSPVEVSAAALRAGKSD